MRRNISPEYFKRCTVVDVRGNVLRQGTGGVIIVSEDWGEHRPKQLNHVPVLAVDAVDDVKCLDVFVTALQGEFFSHPDYADTREITASAESVQPYDIGL